MAQIFDPPQLSGTSSERQKGDGQPYSGRRVSRSYRREREGENTMPVTKEEVGAEEEPSVVKEEIRVRKDDV